MAIPGREKVQNPRRQAGKCGWLWGSRWLSKDCLAGRCPTFRLGSHQVPWCSACLRCALRPSCAPPTLAPHRAACPLSTHEDTVLQISPDPHAPPPQEFSSRISSLGPRDPSQAKRWKFVHRIAGSCEILQLSGIQRAVSRTGMLVRSLLSARRENHPLKQHRQKGTCHRRQVGGSGET